jgi:hypothetical protein
MSSSRICNVGPVKRTVRRCTARPCWLTLAAVSVTPPNATWRWNKLFVPSPLLPIAFWGRELEGALVLVGLGVAPVVGALFRITQPVLTSCSSVTRTCRGDGGRVEGDLEDFEDLG